MESARPYENHARSVALICAASGLGASDTRCGQGPASLLAEGMIARLCARGGDVHLRRTLRPYRRQGMGRNGTIAALCARLGHEVAAAIGADEFPVVLGGDHSCAIGTWSGAARALASRGPLGLVWIDAHMDSHTPSSSHSGMPHGMPLAALLGRGAQPELMPRDELGSPSGPLSARHVCLVGVRSYEPEEARLLRELGVTVFTQEAVDERGIDAVLEDAVRIAGEGTCGYGVSLDLDAVDPADAPAVCTPVANGIPGAGLVRALRVLAPDSRLLALEIAEYNPFLDLQRKTANLIEEIIGAVLGGGAASKASAMELERLHGADNYDSLPVVLVRGRGPYLWDDKGKRYLDLMFAYSAVSLGHCHPRLVDALTRQARTLAVTSRAYYNTRLPVLLERLCRLTGQDKALPVNTGLEAVETALKTVRKWAYKVKGVAADRAEIIACRGNFHGRSIAIVGMSTEPQYRDGFGPFPPGFTLVPFGDAGALERAITPDTAAFLVEPVQGERGIMVPPKGYLAECARICRRNNVLLVADEIQTGLGRTGRLLACDHEGVKPDGLILGKALGGGLLPVSAFLARDDVMAVLQPGDHGSTFGGNPLAAAVALEALDVLEQEQLVARAADLGEFLMSRLRAIASPVVREVRGLGLLVGIVIDPERASALDVTLRLLARGVLTKDTHGTVVRVAPPLVISQAQLEWGVKQIGAVLAEVERETMRRA